MRGATQCARRLGAFVNSLRSQHGKVKRPAVSDPTTQLLLGILSRDVPERTARQTLDELRGMVVDYNELRVIPSYELAEMIGDYHDVRNKSEDIVRALNSVSAREHTVSLDRLRDLPKKETVALLDEIDGLEAYTRARIRLLGLEQHAIPLDEAMWALARQAQIVDKKCPLLEAQSFLERQIDEEDALEFVALLQTQAWAELGAGVRAGEFERIHSAPPDRTTSHMLQDVAPSKDTSLTAPEFEPELIAAVAEGEEVEEQPVKRRRTRKKPPATKKPKPRAAKARPPAVKKKKAARKAAAPKRKRKAAAKPAKAAKRKTKKAKKPARKVKRTAARKKKATARRARSA